MDIDIDVDMEETEEYSLLLGVSRRWTDLQATGLNLVRLLF